MTYADIQYGLKTCAWTIAFPYNIYTCLSLYQRITTRVHYTLGDKSTKASVGKTKEGQLSITCIYSAIRKFAMRPCTEVHQIFGKTILLNTEIKEKKEKKEGYKRGFKLSSSFFFSFFAMRQSRFIPRQVFDENKIYNTSNSGGIMKWWNLQFESDQGKIHLLLFILISDW